MPPTSHPYRRYTPPPAARAREALGRGAAQKAGQIATKLEYLEFRLNQALLEGNVKKQRQIEAVITVRKREYAVLRRKAALIEAKAYGEHRSLRGR